jgi:hypothetical protein
MVELWLQSNLTNEWISVDVDNTLSISVNKSFEEIEDFTTRKSTYTKTFTIPQTKQNNDFFRSCFMVNSSDFSSAIVVNGVIKYGGADVFNGQLRLNKIFNDLNGGTYEVFMTESLPSLSLTLQDIKLTELEFTGMTHELTYDNIVSTWSYTGGSYTNYSGITGNIVYPLIHGGYDPNQYFSSFDTSSTGFTNSNYPIQPAQFAPWVNAKYLIDEMFSRTNFTYNSSFFNDPYFQGIFCLAKSNDLMGARTSSASTENQNVFSANDNRTYIDFAEGNYDTNYFKGFILRNELNDPLNIFSPSLSFQNRGHFFTTAVAGVYKFLISMEISVRFSYLPSTYLNIAIKDVDNGTIYGQIQGLTIFNLSSPTIYNNMLINATIPAGRRVALFYSRQSTGGDPDAELYFLSASLELYSSPILVGSDNVLLQDNLPAQTTCLDFFKGIIQHFNLVVIPTGENSILIEPWDNYFSSGNTLDWSQKLDINAYSLEPTNNLTKEYKLEFGDSQDKLSVLNIQNRNEKFGTTIYVDTEPFHTGQITNTSIFQPLPISTFDDATESNILIPHLYTWNRNAEGSTAPYVPASSDIRLGFFLGMMDSKITGTTTTYYILSGTTAIPHTLYPAVSHLSSYEYSASTFSDLNYQNQYDFWQVWNNSYQGFTENDVFGNFWNGRITQLYEPDTKIFEGQFKLTPEDIKSIQFNDRVYFQEAYWRLYEMTDADITDVSLVNCKFLKLPYDLPAKTYIAPTYQQAEAPFNPTPTGTTYSSLFYSDVNILDMCNQTAPIYQYWSNCSSVSAGCSLYTTSGATSFLDEGTLLKVVGGDNNIYQVGDYGVVSVLTTC